MPVEVTAYRQAVHILGCSRPQAVTLTYTDPYGLYIYNVHGRVRTCGYFAARGPACNGQVGGAEQPLPGQIIMKTESDKIFCVG